MEKVQTVTTFENFISFWNEEFQEHELTVVALKSPLEVTGAVLVILNRIGYDSDVLMSPLPEEVRNNHMVYYQDLLPVINTTRSFNHLASSMSQMCTISISHFLQPTASSSLSMLAFLFNLVVFNEDRLNKIAPSEDELFNRIEQLKELEDKKNNLLQLLNEQIQNKCKRPEILEKLQQSLMQMEEELKLEREELNEEKQQRDALMEENRQVELLCEPKKSQRDAVMAEVERLKAMRVYDADDIRAQVKQAVQNVQEAEQKLSTLGDTLMQKENSLKNLQTTKQQLDTTNTLLDEIIKQAELMKELECHDLESDSKEGELDVLRTALAEERAALAELRAARADALRARDADTDRRHRARAHANSAAREAEEKDAKLREQSKWKSQRTEEIKHLIESYEDNKTKEYEELANVKNNFNNELKKSEDILLKKVTDVKRQIEEKIRNR